MKATSTANLDLTEHLALATACQRRDQYLQQLDELLVSLGDVPPSSPEEIRELFTTYEAPGLPSLSSEIETMREAR
ncbi:MAG: hypothetical protein ETSY2_17805 [Candidatus Entotheonella gemina]|uniref:Uncharacterized protein n=1 Tax=Candidatus Entotheonella gemina TaxID=1429439 RepID=W4M7L6_9BACT|nr:MAG: hypothetical protein ETSY2_17805 [Candidatus Entotheonella gemina]